MILLSVMFEWLDVYLRYCPLCVYFRDILTCKKSSLLFSPVFIVIGVDRRLKKLVDVSQKFEEILIAFIPYDEASTYLNRNIKKNRKRKYLKFYLNIDCINIIISYACGPKLIFALKHPKNGSINLKSPFRFNNFDL